VSVSVFGKYKIPTNYGARSTQISSPSLIGAAGTRRSHSTVSGNTFYAWASQQPLHLLPSTAGAIILKISHGYDVV
jgi:hypothetical protein